MTATTTSKPLSGGRLAAVIGGVASLVLAALLMLAGTGLLWADSRKDDDGYFSTSHERVATTSYAIATDDLDLDGDVIGDALYGKVRLEVDGGKPLFAGIAPTRDVDAYLRGSAHTIMTDVEFDPFDPVYRDSAGTTAPGRPGDETFWAASSETGTLTWDVEDGDWSVVVMNADGSRGVDARVSAGANVAFLDDLGYGLSAVSVLFLALGAALIVVTVRRGRV